MKKERLGRLKCLLFLLLAAVFAIVVPPPETSFSSATHTSQSHGDISAGEGSGVGAAAGTDRGQAAAPANLEEKVPGPGAFLGALLGRLTATSDESEAGIKKLAAGLPQVLPDLNKVLVAL